MLIKTSIFGINVFISIFDDVNDIIYRLKI